MPVHASDHPQQWNKNGRQVRNLSSPIPYMIIIFSLIISANYAVKLNSTPSLPPTLQYYHLPILNFHNPITIKHISISPCIFKNKVTLEWNIAKHCTYSINWMWQWCRVGSLLIRRVIQKRVVFWHRENFKSDSVTGMISEIICG